MPIGWHFKWKRWIKLWRSRKWPPRGYSRPEFDERPQTEFWWRDWPRAGHVRGHSRPSRLKAGHSWAGICPSKTNDYFGRQHVALCYNLQTVWQEYMSSDYWRAHVYPNSRLFWDSHLELALIQQPRASDLQEWPAWSREEDERVICKRLKPWGRWKGHMQTDKIIPYILLHSYRMTLEASNA